MTEHPVDRDTATERRGPLTPRGLSLTPTDRTVHTFCRYCLAGCGVTVTVDAQNHVTKIAADKDNPYTWHDFCAKGRTAAEVLEHPRRILSPMRRVGDRYEEASWEEAITDISTRLNAIIDQHGPDALGTYWGSPAAGGAANIPFQNAFLDSIGTQQRYAVGSVDQNSWHAVAEKMYGSVFMALVSDVDQCDFFLIIGGNPAVSTYAWLEYIPAGWRRVLERQRQGATVVVVDPIRTETAKHADLHLAIRPGQDWALLLGMIKVIFEEGLEHRADCDEMRDTDAVRSLAASADLDDLAARCDIPVEQIRDLARKFATARTANCVTRTGVAHHLTGAVGEWLGHLLSHITGRVDRPGGHRFERGFINTAKVTKQWSAPVEHISRVAGRPMVAGHHSLAELPGEITTPGRGQIRAMMINAGNPVISGPAGDNLDRALAQLDLLVAVDIVQRESHRHAHWLIPGTHWLEREELWTFATQLLDQPYVFYGRRAVNLPPGVRHEWQFWTDLTLAMRRPLFGKRGVNTVIKASRALAKITRRPGLAFDPTWIDRLLVRTGRRLKWKDILAHEHGWVYGEREYGNFAEHLMTEDKKVHAAPPEFVAACQALLRTPRPTAPAGYPYQLSNRRNRHSLNSWLNEQPSLHKGRRTNDMEIHPKDAADLGVTAGDRVRVSSPHGTLEAEVQISDAPRQGVVVLAHGWGSRVFDPRGGAEPQSFGTNRNRLVGGDEVDPISQTPALSSTYVAVEPVD